MPKVEMVVLMCTLSLASLAGRGAFDLILPEISYQTEQNILPEGLVINEIVMRVDGYAVYDRSALIDGAHYAWSGQVYDLDGSVHCQGGNTWRYPASAPERRVVDVDWLVGDDCSGLVEGMAWRFSYTSVDGSLSDIKYPPVGLGVILPVESKIDQGKVVQ